RGRSAQDPSPSRRRSSPNRTCLGGTLSFSSGSSEGTLFGSEPKTAPATCASAGAGQRSVPRYLTLDPVLSKPPSGSVPPSRSALPIPVACACRPRRYRRVSGECSSHPESNARPADLTFLGGWLVSDI